MSNDFLSQDEIDALLNGNANAAPTSPEAGQSGSNESSTADISASDFNPDDYLTPFDRDAIGELGNITFGTAATTLSTLLRQKVNITTPIVKIIRNEEVKGTLTTPQVIAKVGYTEGLTGSNVLAISARDAQIIADLMLGGDGSSPNEELNELHLSAVAEAMNQMMGSASTSMSTMFNMTVNISPPSVSVVDLDSDDHGLFVPSPEVLVEVSFQLQVGELIDSYIMQLFPVEFAHTLVANLMGAGQEQSAQVVPPAPSVAEQQVSRNTSVPPQSASQPVHVMAGTTSYSEMGQSVAHQPVAFTAPVPQVERAVFTSFDETPSTHAGRNLDLLLDIPLGITVELGRTKRMIKDILDLAPGAIVELDKLAGEPVDILVNNKLIARGEVVVVEENFGVRVIDILSPTERIKRLQ
jgi:flagellar motor switch protein FliN/FliY